MVALIVAGGKKPGKELLYRFVEKADIIIGADSGGKSLKHDDIETFALVGDFDSLDKNSLKWFKRNNTQILISNEDKDETDTMLAVDLAVDEGAKKIYILGALGQRMDHQYANIALLMYAKRKGAKAFLTDEKNCAFIADKNEEIQASTGDFFSVFSVSKKAKFISSDGLKYPLDGLVLRRDTPIGVSNEATESVVKIAVKKGEVLIIKSLE